MIPATREDLKTYCLRKLGFPVININVDDDQLEDRIDECITYGQTYHYDLKKLAYTKYQMTANDIASNPISIQMSANTIGVNRIFTISSSEGTSTNDGFNMFDINYQIRLNELYDYTAGDYTYFEIANEHLRMLEMLFTGEIPIAYNRYNQQLNIFAAPGRFNEGNWTIIEVYLAMDPTDAFWGDPWVIKYCTALFKKQWGENLKKFQSVTLPGGMVLNGQQIWNEAHEDCLRWEEELRKSFEDPPCWIFG